METPQIEEKKEKPSDKHQENSYYICEKCGELLNNLTEVSNHSKKEKHYEFRNNKFDNMRLMLV
jgi:adenine-specific DNA methylase